MRLKDILKTILYEERLGSIPYRRGIEYDVYKNPSSISRMESDLRAISDKSGNLYVLDHDGWRIIHSDFATWLSSNGQNIPAGENVWKKITKVICWQRLGKTNKFYLSESYKRDEGEIDKIIEKSSKLIDNVRKKQSTFKFIIKSIRDTQE